jgi:predicted transposase YbfD/YdcC
MAIYGNVLRRSFDRASSTSALHMASAWGCEQRLVLAQIATDAKSNEITAVPKLLAMRSLKGTIVTAVALNCQRAIAQQIVDQGGDCALALKGNRARCITMSTGFSVTRQASSRRPSQMSMPVTAGSRHERRVFGRISSGCSYRWAEVTAVGKVDRLRETPAETATEMACYLLSTALSAERLNAVARQHWGVENRLHGQMDVVMNEDQDRARLGNGPQNLAVVGNMALNAMQKEGSKGSLRGKFKRAGWDDAYLTRLLALF